MIETKVTNLEINELTEEQYKSAKTSGSLNSNAFYMTPGGENTSVITPINLGGTNATTAANARINLGFEYGESVPTHVPSTGDGAIYFKTNNDDTEVLPIEEGGTNAVTAEEARTNLGITPVIANRFSQTFTTPSTNWFYTGVAITIPANSIYGINAESVYSNGQAYGAAIAYNSTNANSILEWNEGTTFYDPSVSTTAYTPTEITRYIWAKYAVANKLNYVNVSYWYKVLE